MSAQFISIKVLCKTVHIYIIGNLWCPISGESRALTKADKHIHFHNNNNNKNTHTHTHTTHTYKHTDINCMQQHTPHAHAHTHTEQKTSILVMGLMDLQKKENDKSVGRREEVEFQF